MKLVLIGAAVLLPVSGASVAQQANSVRGHVRSDGTYVAPHMRTNPDSTRLNNWSSTPNVNPYTGKVGTVDPYAPRTTNPYSSTYKPYKPARY